MNLIPSFIEKWSYDELDKSIFYHYTDLNALQSMLDKEDIWFSYVKHSNDTNEFSLGMDLFIQRFSDRKLDFDGLLDVDGWISQLIAQKESPEIRPCIFCVSEKPDQLSQWRGYGNQGKGISLGLKKELFLDNNQCIFKKVIYEKKIQSKLVDEVIDDIKKLIVELAKLGEIDRESLIASFVQVVFTLSLVFKDENFYEECEWRCIYIPNPKNQNIHFRSKFNEKLILFCTQKINLELIEEIKLGPISAKHFENIQSLEIIKEQKNLKFKISKSSIPFHV